MTYKRIAIITPWNAVCGVSEFANFLVEALEKRGHTFEIFANFFAGEYEKIPETVRKDGLNVHRIFQTGFHHDPYIGQQFDVIEVEATIVSKKIDLLILNYQDFIYRNKSALNIILEFCKNNRIKTFILFHDSCISPELDTSLADHLVFSPAVYQYQSHSKALTLDQGIPEFDFPNAQYSPTTDRWWISCFGMGRNKIDSLIKVVEDINSEKMLEHTLHIHLLCRHGHYDEYKGHKYVLVDQGYVEARSLADCLHDSDAVVIWYPDINMQATSSAFRFAVGSKTPIIANRSAWICDMLGNGCFVEVERDYPELFKRAIIKLFQKDTYPVAREKMTILQQKLIDRSGWSKIAETYEHYF
jgi:hypothetical protein